MRDEQVVCFEVIVDLGLREDPTALSVDPSRHRQEHFSSEHTPTQVEQPPMLGVLGDSDDLSQCGRLLCPGVRPSRGVGDGLLGYVSRNDILFPQGNLKGGGSPWLHGPSTDSPNRCSPLRLPFSWRQASEPALRRRRINRSTWWSSVERRPSFLVSPHPGRQGCRHPFSPCQAGLGSS